MYPDPDPPPKPCLCSLPSHQTMAPKHILFAFIFLSLSSLSFSLPADHVSDAIQVLQNSGSPSMALVLMYASTLCSRHPVTFFAPSDAVPQPPNPNSLLFLRYHFVPFTLSVEKLQSLPYGMKIPTLYPNHSLTVTTSNDHISINNVKVKESPIFNDTSFTIFGIESFFNPEFTSPVAESYVKNPSGVFFNRPSLSSLLFPRPTQNVLDAVLALSSSCSTIMAQMIRFSNMLCEGQAMTVFSPPDTVPLPPGGVTADLIQCQFTPFKLSSDLLSSLPFGVKIPTLSPGRPLTVTTQNTVSLNNVVIAEEPIYDDGSLTIFVVQKFFNPNFTISVKNPEIPKTEEASARWEL